MIKGQDRVRVIGDDYTMVVEVPDVGLGKSHTEGVWTHIQEGRNLVWITPSGNKKVVVLNPTRVSWIEL